MADSGKRLADGNATREQKRRKWEAKQSRKREEEEREKVRQQWVDSHSDFASFVSEDDIKKVKSSQSERESDLSLCLLPFVDIQETGSKNAKFNDGQRYFIAESTETIRILIQQSTQTNANHYGLSPIQLKSIFLKPCSLFDEPVRLINDVEEAMRIRRERDSQNSNHPGFKVLIGSEFVLSMVAGFPIARGALACGIVPMGRDEAWLDSFLQNKRMSQKSEPLRMLALDGICDNANLGSMIRTASAFGVDVVVLSQDTCDCWYRRTIRVSMGHIFRIPIVRVNNLAATISKWSSPRFNVTSYAAVLETNCLLSDIKRGNLPKSWCCIMGNEGNGISLAVREAATHKLRIQIESEVDSLSVPVATGILLNGLREREAR
ncbi:unnamed protein product [Cylindrotheca closterium]|uniref:tRNA/rRNA methyltransferase SpoU type domain-containing protein n=1 Tax=Cylindrotheca closterium TaxID=2856 RepID=A0AAD2JPC8_9STRA|nr:unnamed protein product [Cylindrotheca closterium]